MKEPLRFLLFTLISASAGLVELASFALLNEFTSWQYWPCYLIAVTLSVLWNFTINRRYTFRSNANITRAMLLVALYYVAFIPLTTWLGDWFVEDLNWNEYLVTIINMLLNFTTEFLYQRCVVYKGKVDSRNKVLSVLFFLTISLSVTAQVWNPNLPKGMYQNPILYADYSDPDVCRVGEDFYMTSSSFNAIPGLQILHSKDLVNWEIINAALPYTLPGAEDSIAPQYGKCVWAPAIRHHEGYFYIFYGDPDRGIYRLRTKDIRGTWEKPVLVMPAKGYIDPCPFWDEDGRVYLAHALAGSRAQLKSVLLMAELDKTATTVISPSRIVFDGHQNHPTCEGPKLYKRNGYYYIFTPAGGVATGWQLVLRSKNIYGPYEEKVVLQQGNTPINGPHQGAWVDTEAGENWFLHFQDVGTYGRVVHLQPMTWDDDWPVIGNEGEPVAAYNKPAVTAEWKACAPKETDEFDAPTLGYQWQWAAQPNPKWYFCDAQNSLLRLYSYYNTTPDIANLLLQKTSAPAFTITAKVRFSPSAKHTGEEAGIIVSGKRSARFFMRNYGDYVTLMHGGMGSVKVEKNEWVYLRVIFYSDATCQFAYSLNGVRYFMIDDLFKATEGHWTGCKVGLFCTRKEANANDGGWLDVDYWRITPNK